MILVFYVSKEVTYKRTMPRNAYKKAISKDRERIVSCYESGGDWRALADSLDINKKTAYTWLKSNRRSFEQRGGNRPKKLTEEQIDIVCVEVERNPAITLKGLVDKIKAIFDIDVSIQTVYNYLHGRLITLKKAHVEIITMNDAPNKEKRRQYVERISHFMQQNKTIIWMDETNLNLFCRRTQSRSRRGERAINILPSCRGPNVHVIGATSSFQVIKWSRRRGSFKADTAMQWVEDMLLNLPHGISPDTTVLVIDNAPCHSRIEECEARFPGFIVQRLGPYSPMLNPIENIWSKVKSLVKNQMKVPNVMPPAVGEQRLAFVETLIDRAMGQVTNRDCANCCQHAQGFFRAVLNGENMQVGR